jgi:hypothetical protein
MKNLATNVTTVSFFAMVILVADNYLLSGYIDHIISQGYKRPYGYYRYFCWHAYPKPLVSISNREWTELWICSAQQILFGG